jgi:hypothetical protein
MSDRPILLLNFDVNGTLILQDNVKKEDAESKLISALAESTEYKWDDLCPHPITFKKYTTDYLFPGDKSDRELKSKRTKFCMQFLDWLKEKKHPLEKEVFGIYSRIVEKYTVDGAPVFTNVFPSFYELVKELDRLKYEYVLIFRTFGSDLPDVAKQLAEHGETPVKIRYWGKFVENGKKISIDGKGEFTHLGLYKLFIQSCGEHFALQDDWKRWNGDGERGRSGKPFLYDESGSIWGRKNLALFFDDNITGEELDIVQGSEVMEKNKKTSKELFGDLAFAVNTTDAMVDDNYYKNLVFDALKRKGYISSSL